MALDELMDEFPTDVRARELPLTLLRRASASAHSAS